MVIYVVNVELFDGSVSKTHWLICLFVPFCEACSTSFNDFLEKYIRKVRITDFVLSNIGGFELKVFQNKMGKLDFPKQQQTAQDMLGVFIFFKGITIIEHNNLFFGYAIFNDELDLAMF